MKNVVLLTLGLGLTVMWGSAEVRAHRLQLDLDSADTAYKYVFTEGTYLQIAVDYGISEACSMKAYDDAERNG